MLAPPERTSPKRLTALSKHLPLAPRTQWWRSGGGAVRDRALTEASMPGGHPGSASRSFPAMAPGGEGVARQGSSERQHELVFNIEPVTEGPRRCELTLNGTRPFGQGFLLPRDVFAHITHVGAEELQVFLGDTVARPQRLMRLTHELHAQSVAGEEAGDAIQPAPLPPTRTERQCRYRVVAAGERLPRRDLVAREAETLTEP